MLYTEKNARQQKNSTLSTMPAGQHTARTFIHQFTGEELKDCLVLNDDSICAMEELIFTAEAAFEFIQNREELNMKTKNCFYQLQRQFDFYKNLLSL